MCSLKLVFSGLLISLILAGCSNPATDSPAANVPASGAKAITAFSFESPSATGIINESNYSVEISVPFGTDVTTLVPTITHTGTNISPASGAAQNFTNLVVYTVTAADKSTQNYTVTVKIGPSSAFNESFEDYAVITDIANWSFNTKTGISYKFDKTTKYSGLQCIKFEDSQNGDRAHMYRNFSSVIHSATLVAFVYLPSTNAPDLAQIQLKGTSIGDICDVDFSRSGNTYNARTQQDGVAWEVIKSGLPSDQWIKVNIAFDNDTFKSVISINDAQIGTYNFNSKNAISRIELNGGGWGNTTQMDVYFDDVSLQSVK